MGIKNKCLVLATAAACALACAAYGVESDKEKQQKEIRNVAQQTLHQLYKAEPKTKAAIAHAAASVSDGVWMYQLTEKGLAAEISATGTKYYKDDGLN